MRSLRTAASAGLALLLGGALAAADKAAEEKSGPMVGAKAPAFTLKDQSGKERTLQEFVQQGKVALVFFRSASW